MIRYYTISENLYCINRYCVLNCDLSDFSDSYDKRTRYKRLKTQLYAVSPAEPSNPKRWVSLVFLFGVRSVVGVECCVAFQGFVFCVQPNLRDYCTEN